MDDFEKSRKELSDRLKEVAELRGDRIIEKTIPFLNDDVPKYLRRLNRFEEKSRKTNIRVGFYAEPQIYF